MDSMSKPRNIQGKTERCPECGDLFQDKRALGSHRRYKHGVLGVPHTKEGWEKRQHVERIRETAELVKAKGVDPLKGNKVVDDLLDELERLRAVERAHIALLEQLAAIKQQTRSRRE